MHTKVFRVSLLGLVLLLMGCNLPSQTHQATQEPSLIGSATSANPSTSTPPSAPTRTRTKTPTIAPKASATATAIPIPAVSAPAGIVYRTQHGLFVTELTGKSRLLLELSEHEWAYLSPNKTHALVFDYSFVNTNVPIQSTVDLHTGQWTPLYPQVGHNLCPFYWLNNQFLVTTLLPDEADPGYSCARGTPAYIRQDGTGLTIVDQSGFGYGSPAASPTGQSIAYDIEGEPRLYEWGKQNIRFDVTAYDFPIMSEAIFTDPSWSNSGEKLAWTVSGKLDGGKQQGIAVFDLRQKTSAFLFPYDVIDYEGSRPEIVWSGDDNFILFGGYDNSEQDFIARILSIDGKTVRKLDRDRFLRWSPRDAIFAVMPIVLQRDF